jgi:hypothetical protein
MRAGYACVAGGDALRSGGFEDLRGRSRPSRRGRGGHQVQSPRILHQTRARGSILRSAPSGSLRAKPRSNGRRALSFMGAHASAYRGHGGSREGRALFGGSFWISATPARVRLPFTEWREGDPGVSGSTAACLHPPNALRHRALTKRVDAAHGTKSKNSPGDPASDEIFFRGPSAGLA